MSAADELHTGELHSGMALVGSQSALLVHFSRLAELRMRLTEFVAQFGGPEAPIETAVGGSAAATSGKKSAVGAGTS